MWRSGCPHGGNQEGNLPELGTPTVSVQHLAILKTRDKTRIKHTSESLKELRSHEKIRRLKQWVNKKNFFLTSILFQFYTENIENRSWQGRLLRFLPLNRFWTGFHCTPAEEALSCEKQTTRNGIVCGLLKWVRNSSKKGSSSSFGGLVACPGWPWHLTLGSQSQNVPAPQQQ